MKINNLASTSIFILKKWFYCLPILLSFTSCIKPKTHIKPDDSIFYLNQISNIASDTINLKNIYATELGISIDNVSVKTCSCDKKLIKIHAPNAASLLFTGSQIQTRPTGGAGGGGLPNIFSTVASNIANFEPNIVFEAPEIKRVNGEIIPPNIKSDARVNPESLKLDFDPIITDKITTIAILDSGLPIDLLNKNFIWKDSLGGKGFDFINNDNLPDEDINPHGNNVVAFMAEELSKKNIKNTNLMILKVLDSKNQGDYFDILCGILYAYQNNASILNLSLGYYGQRSDFLKKFLEAKNFKNPKTDLPYNQNKWIITAAGNIDTQADFLETTFHKRNLSTRKNTFYPAYFAKDLNNVLAITSIESFERVASNQNFSKKVVDLGVKTDNGVNFNLYGNSFTGSSFATPIFTAFITDYFNNNRTDTSKVGNILTLPNIKTNETLEGQIKNGKYIEKSL